MNLLRLHLGPLAISYCVAIEAVCMFAEVYVFKLMHCIFLRLYTHGGILSLYVLWTKAQIMLKYCCKVLDFEQHLLLRFKNLHCKHGTAFCFCNAVFNYGHCIKANFKTMRVRYKRQVIKETP